MGLESMGLEEVFPQLEQPEGGVNISAALEVLAQAEAGTASREDINETVKSLQELQNMGIKDPAIQSTLARLIAARGE